MLPVITIVGRPNVGKSTLFNFLTQSRDALVADIPGVTRDRQYGSGKVGDRPYIVVDTGGLAEPDDPEMAKHTDEQVEQAMEEGDVLLFLVDAQDGLSSADEEIARRLRKYGDKVVLVVNKADRESGNVVSSEFYQLGLGDPQPIASKGGRGVLDLMHSILQRFPADVAAPLETDSTRIAVIGRPNVGKSTLINRILGEDRVIVLDRPGTTRDSIYIPFERQGRKYTLIDTAGVRRRPKVQDMIEKFSVIKALQAIKEAHVVIVVVNAQEGLSDQDLRLLGYVLDAGKGLIVAINKWDGMEDYAKDQLKQALDRRLVFVTFARRYFISALHGTGVGKLYRAVDEAYESAIQDLSTAQLTRALEQALKDHQPPLVRGRRIRMRYAHLGGHDPLVIVIHGKQVDDLPQSYQRYLATYFRERFNLVGIPVQLQFKQDNNPYVD